MSLRPLLVGLKNLVLQMLWQKFKYKPIVEIDITLTIMPHPCPKPNSPIL